MSSLLNYTFYNNTVLRYLIFLGCLLAGLLAVRILLKIGLKRLNLYADRSKKKYWKSLVQGVRKYLAPILYFTVVMLCVHTLTLTLALQGVLDIAVKVFFSFYGGWCISRLAAFFIGQYWKKRNREKESKIAYQWINGIAQFVIWCVIGILFLQNIGVKIDALIAGLGIGGLSIAFAAQVVLEDIFCFFTIFFDRPFEIGDFIVAGEQMGTVEHIGVKTTRLRTLDGEQLILSNKDLTSSRIQNYKTMEQRRVLFTLGVTYQTDAATLREIPDILRGIVGEVEGASFLRAHFFSFGDSSLDFEVAYYVLSSDYDRYMDIRQQINLKIKETFDLKGIDFAYPTRTLTFSGDLPVSLQPRNAKAQK